MVTILVKYLFLIFVDYFNKLVLNTESNNE